MAKDPLSSMMAQAVVPGTVVAPGGTKVPPKGVSKGPPAPPMKPGKGPSSPPAPPAAKKGFPKKLPK